MLATILLQFAANTYNCDAYGAGSYGRCLGSSSNSGSLGDTGTKILLISVIAAIVLFISLLLRFMLKRRAK